MVELKALGTAEIQTDSSTITPSQEIVFAAALYLVVGREKPTSRARLAMLLWPSVPRAVQGHRLRQTLFQLKQLGLPVTASRDVIQIASNVTRVDVDEFVKDPLPSLDRELEFLPGYDPRLSAEFRDWIDDTRDSVHTALTVGLLARLNAARDSARWAEVDRIARYCLKLDPYNETAVLSRAEASAMRGQKAAAVSILDRYIEELTPRDPKLVLPATVLRNRVNRALPQPPRTQFITHEPDCVGRHAEMTVLAQLLNNAREGQGGACLLHGEPGIGKTRLSSELAKFAELRGARVERVACRRSDTHQPLSAFVSLVPRLRELPGALGCSEQNLSWLKRLTEFDTSVDSPGARTDDAGSVYTNIRSAVFDLLDAVSEERCLVIVVDDVQWLDGASASLFGSVIEWVSARKLLLVFISRLRNSLIQESAPPDRLTVVDVGPLNDGDAHALVSGVMGSTESDSHRNDFAWLIRVADGNPYFLQELAKHWLETGQRHATPPSVAVVLNERISRLSSMARQLLEACVVLGENSNLERIEQLLEYAPHDLLIGLQELSLAGMIRSGSVGESSTPSLQVRHDLLAIEVTKGLAPVSLAFLHRRCGTVLEREVLGTSISTSLLRSCAFHWHEAGDSKRAYELAVKCASHLIEIGLATDAAVALEGTLVFCSTVEQQLVVLERIVQALRMARESAAALKTIARIRALQGSRSALEHHDDLEIIEFEALRATDGAMKPLFARVLSCVYNTSLSAAHRVSVALVGQKLATSLADLRELNRIYSAVEPLLSEDTVGRRTRLQVLVVYNTMCGDLRDAVRFARERVAFERCEGTPSQLVSAITDLSFVLRVSGPEDEILEVLTEGYEIAKRYRLYVASRDCAERISAFLVAGGRPGFEQWLDRALDYLGDAQPVGVLFSVHTTQARIALRERRFEDAERILEEEIPWEWLRDRRGWLAAGLALRIRLRVARGQTQALSRDVEELRALNQSTAGLGAQDFEVAALCAGLNHLGDQPAARKYLTNYLSSQRRDLTPYSPELTEICEVLVNVPQKHGTPKISVAIFDLNFGCGPAGATR